MEISSVIHNRCHCTYRLVSQWPTSVEALMLRKLTYTSPSVLIFTLTLPSIPHLLGKRLKTCSIRRHSCRKVLFRPSPKRQGWKQFLISPFFRILIRDHTPPIGTFDQINNIGYREKETFVAHLSLSLPLYAKISNVNDEKLRQSSSYFLSSVKKTTHIDDVWWEQDWLTDGRAYKLLRLRIFLFFHLVQTFLLLSFFFFFSSFRYYFYCSCSFSSPSFSIHGQILTYCQPIEEN